MKHRINKQAAELMPQPERTYKNKDNAIKAIEKVLNEAHESYFTNRYNDQVPMRYIIVTVEDRYTPLLLPDPNLPGQMQMAISLAHKGFASYSS